MTILKNIFGCLTCQGNIDDYENEYEPADEESSSEDVIIPLNLAQYNTSPVQPQEIEIESSQEDKKFKIQENYSPYNLSHEETTTYDKQNESLESNIPRKTEITRRCLGGPIYVRDYSPPTYHRFSTKLDPYVRNEDEWIIS